MIAFDPSQPSEAVTPSDGFDPSKPSESVGMDEPLMHAHTDEKNWPSLYAGLDGLESRLTPTQQQQFAQLDANTEDPKESRARAINQAYLQTQLPNLSPQLVERNWEAVKASYAKNRLGLDEKPMPDAAFYVAIGKRMQDDHDEELYGTVKPWTWKDTVGSDARMVGESLGKFWASINQPIAAIPDAPKNLPDLPGLGINNPAIVGGVFNALKPLVEGLESPFGIATMSGGGMLAKAAKTYPAAKVALASMSGIFAGIMGHATVQGAKEVPKVFNDPDSTFQDKVEALASPVATGAATLLGALGVALEALPEKAPAIVKKLDGVNPAEAAQVLREEATAIRDGTASPELELPHSVTLRQSDFLDHAATLFDEIADPSAIEAVKAEAEAPKIEPVKPKAKAETLPTVTSDEPASKQASEKLFSIKNAAVDKELEEMGLLKATHGEKLSAEEARADAAKKIEQDPFAGQKLVDELTEKPRPLTGKEDALLTHEITRRGIERNQAEQALIDAVEANDTEGAQVARNRIAAARDAYQVAAEIATKAGTENAQGLALRRMMMKEDFSLAAMERRRVVANDGKPLSEAQEANVRELHEKLNEKQKAFDDYRSRMSELLASDETPARTEKPTRKGPPSKVSAFISERASEARARIQKRLSEGRVSSGLDPADLADHAIVGAEYLTKGLTKFTDWSVAMVKEFGEKITPHLQAIFDKATHERYDAARLQSLKTRTLKTTEDLQKKLETGDLSKKPRKPIPLDAEAIRLKADLERVKKEVTLAELKDHEQNRTRTEKVRDAFTSWVRMGALSYPTVLAKLTGAAVIRTASTPIEQAVGYGVSKLLPGLSKLAPREGVPEIKGALRAEAKALTEGMTTGMRGAWDMLRNRDTDLAALFEKTHLPPSMAEYLGKIHGALKYPTKINEYARSLELRTAHALRNGLDPTEPLTQMRLMHEAYMDSNRAIFMQDNGVVDAYKAGLATLERTNKATGKPSAALQFLATGIRTELPIVKVPTNVIAEASQILTGWLTGPVKAAFAYAHGIENLKPAEADAILRLIKKGSIGLALTALGVFKAQEIGGFYEKGEKREQSDVQPGEVRLGDATIPSQLLHNPYITALHFGSTMERAASSRFKKSDTQHRGELAGLIAAATGLIEEVPFVRETTTVGKYLDPHQQGNALSDKAASILVPGAVQFIAGQMDKKEPFNLMESPRARKPDGFVQTLEKKIPGLREDVPQKTTGKPAFRK